MSTIKTNAHQIGVDGVTPANNFTLATPAIPDGTLLLYRGNAFTPISTVFTVDASNNITFTGAPAAPTAAAGTSTTQIATTAFTRTALKNIPVFRAVRDAASDQMLTNASLTPILYNTVQKSSGSYNPANGQWTPNVAGWWQVNYTGLMNYSTATGWDAVFIALIKNGAEFHRAMQAGNLPAQIWGASGATLVYMNGTTDYLQVGLYGDTNTNVTPYANSGASGPLYNNLSAFLAIPDA